MMMRGRIISEKLIERKIEKCESLNITLHLVECEDFERRAILTCICVPATNRVLEICGM